MAVITETVKDKNKQQAADNCNSNCYTSNLTDI